MNQLHRDKKKSNMKIVLGIVGVVGVLLAGAGYSLFSVNAPQNSADSTLYDVTIKDGDGLAEVAELLKEKGVVRQDVMFRYAMILTGERTKIQTGNYELSPQASILETINIITQGDQQQEGSVTIQEGLSNAQVASLLAEYFADHSTEAIADDELKKTFEDEFLQEMNNVDKYRSDYSFLESVPENGTLEGYLFPDTYRFFKRTEPETVIRKMLDNFDLKLNRDLRVEIASQGKSIHEVVTLAAIVQREVSEEYMKDVAGIFYNRLAIGMKLQSDATVNYVTNADNPQPTFAELEVDSRYNTYRYAGLPPGPISNPGIRAIEASVFPADNDYFFFLTRLDTGEAIYAKNGTQHLQNKEKYLDNN